MFLTHLELTHYRSYAELHADFSARKVILLGDNGQGKSNLLEAIGLLATGKSPIAQRDVEIVRWNAESAVIRADVSRELTALHVDMLLRPHARRAVRVNGTSLKRMADLFGRVLVVLFRSEDLQLVKGGPGDRREFLDTMLIQISGTYYQRLRDYDRVLTQRNHLLREVAAGQAASSQLDEWDEQLAVLATGIWERRAQLASRLVPRASSWYGRISDGKETLEMRYVPSVPSGSGPWIDEVRQALARVRAKEIARGATLVGPHRDDVELLLDGRPARAFGSQGQQRTIVLSLKLSELEVIEEATGEAPLLLLDDVLAELDVKRQNALLASIGDRIQTFVTSTHLNDFSARWLDEADVYRVEAGQLRAVPRGGWEAPF